MKGFHCTQGVAHCAPGIWGTVGQNPENAVNIIMFKWFTCIKQLKTKGNVPLFLKQLLTISDIPEKFRTCVESLMKMMSECFSESHHRSHIPSAGQLRQEVKVSSGLHVDTYYNFWYLIGDCAHPVDSHY